MPARLFDFLEMPRYKMAFFFRYNKVESSTSKSQIARVFGYKSDGHFYPDFNYLLNNGLIEEKDGYYQIGREGKIEFRFYTVTEISLAFSIAFAIIFFIYFIGTYFGHRIPPISLLMFSILQMFTAIVCFITLRTFIPDLPSEVETLKVRGKWSQLLDRFSRK